MAVVSNPFSDIESVAVTYMGDLFWIPRLGHTSMLNDVVQTWCSPACPHVTQCAGSDIWDTGQLTAPKIEFARWGGSVSLFHDKKRGAEWEGV